MTLGVGLQSPRDTSACGAVVAIATIDEASAPVDLITSGFTAEQHRAMAEWDAETGTGVEVGAGIRYAAGAFSVEGEVHALIPHERRATRTGARAVRCA